MIRTVKLIYDSNRFEQHRRINVPNNLNYDVWVKVIEVFLDLCFPHVADIMEKDITKKGAASTPCGRTFQVVGKRNVTADDIGTCWLTLF